MNGRFTKLFLLFTFYISIFFLNTHHLNAQVYSCGSCGSATITSISKSPATGCNVTVNLTINTNDLSCVNTNWLWSTSPSGSSGSFYVGFTTVVPYAQTASASFYIPLACSALGSSFFIIDSPGSSTCENIPLPVIYSHISAEGNIIYWTTSSEVNNAKYIIEISSDGIVWFTDGIVTPLLDLTQNNEYQYQLKAFAKYARIAQVDFDGSRNYSKIIPIDYFEQPTTQRNESQVAHSDNLIIQLPSKHFTEYRLINIYGQLLEKGLVMNAELNFTKHNLPTGQYFLWLQSPQNTNEIIKIMAIN